MNWKWSNFEIVNIVMRECITADEAYRRLREFEQELEVSAESIRIESVRRSSVAIHAEERHAYTDGAESDRVLAETFTASAENVDKMERGKYDCDIDALLFVRYLIRQIQPHRRYVGLLDSVAHQLCQFPEARLRLVRSAYISLLSTGYVPPDLLLEVRSIFGWEPIMEAVLKLQHAYAEDANAFARLNLNDLYSTCDPEVKLLPPKFASHASVCLIEEPKDGN